LGFFGRIFLVGDYVLEDRDEKAAVVIEGCAVVQFHSLLDGSLGCGGYEFEAADEDAHGFCGSGVDRERQNAVHELARDDVEQAAACVAGGLLDL